MNLPPLATSIAAVRSELEFTSCKRFQGRAAFFAISESVDQKIFQGVEWLTVEKAEGKAAV